MPATITNVSQSGPSRQKGDWVELVNEILDETIEQKEDGTYAPTGASVTVTADSLAERDGLRSAISQAFGRCGLGVRSHLVGGRESLTVEVWASEKRARVARNVPAVAANESDTDEL